MHPLLLGAFVVLSTTLGQSQVLIPVSIQEIRHQTQGGPTLWSVVPSMSEAAPGGRSEETSLARISNQSWVKPECSLFGP